VREILLGRGAAVQIDFQGEEDWVSGENRCEANISRFGKDEPSYAKKTLENIENDKGGDDPSGDRSQDWQVR